MNAIPDSATRKFGGAILLATSSLGLAAVPLPVAAGPGVAVVSVRTMVSPTIKMQFESSSMQLSITEEDIAHGYIDVPGTNRLTLNSDRSAQQLANISLDYEPDPYQFSSSQLATSTLPAAERNADSGLAGSINALPASAGGPSGEASPGAQDDAGFSAPTDIKPSAPRGSVTSFGYRLMLPKSIKPGDLSVPVTLNIQL